MRGAGTDEGTHDAAPGHAAGTAWLATEPRAHPDHSSAERRLLDAGFRLFGTRGLDGTRVVELCREAHVSTRNFYRCVAGSDALFLDVFDREVRRILVPAAQAMEASSLLWTQRFRIWVEHWARTISADPRRCRILYVEGVGRANGVDEHRRQRLRTSYELYMQNAALCAAATQGDALQPGNFRVEAVTVMGAARELAMQLDSGWLTPADIQTVVDEVVHLAGAAAT